MNTIVKLYIKYRNNLIINFTFGLLLLVSSVIVFFITVYIESSSIVIFKADLLLFFIGVLNMLFGYRRIVNILDNFRETRLSKSIDRYNLEVK